MKNILQRLLELRALLSKPHDNGKTYRCFFESETISID
jgi:hypothetical protein